MTGKKNKEISLATGFQCPMLNNSNFNIWAIRVQVILEANDLWEVMEPQTTTQIDNKADKTAIAFIFQALPEDQILQVAKHKSTRTVWDALKTRHVGENRVQQLTENGCKVAMEKSILLSYDSNGNILLRVMRSKNRLCKANLRIGGPTCLLANLHDEAWLWHARLGHLNFKSLKSMTTKNLVQGIPSIKHSTDICDTCLIGKHARTPFPQQAKYRSKTALDLIYEDLCGPISPPTPSGKRYIFLLVDDCSGYMWEYFLNSKDQAFGVFKEFKTRAKKEHGTKIKTFRTDRGGEFTSNEFHKYYRENGIIRQLTAPYSP
nr:zinc finger, CCHC-type [Tanacetum cinerariifolium]